MPGGDEGLHPVEWVVVAGPPGSPKTMTSYEDLERLKKILKQPTKEKP